MANAPDKTQTTVSDVLKSIDRIAPFSLAESWDNVGLQIGHPDRPANHVMTALEITSDVAAQAIKGEVDLLVVHHPLLFRPVNSLAETTPTLRLVGDLQRAGISLIAAHTNLDSVAVGTNGELADRLGLMTAGREYLLPHPATTNQVKYVVFAPLEYADRLIEAFHAAGAATIGNYSHCSFRVEGTGTFRALEGANPFLGQINELEQAREVRLECLCPKHRLPTLLSHVRAVHPYEEIAYDVFPIVPTGKPSSGLGLTGDVGKALTLRQIAAEAEKQLPRCSPKVVGNASAKIKRIAVVTGSGSEAIRRWPKGAADLLVTGEATHHDCLDAQEKGLSVLLLGHWQSEVIVAGRLASLIAQELGDCGLTIPKLSVAKEKPPLAPL